MKTIIANKRKVSILFDADLVDVKVTNVNICFYEENFGLLMLPYQGFERMVTLGLFSMSHRDPEG